MTPGSAAIVASVACSVCGAGANDPTSNAYLASTMFLSLFPLGLIFGGLGLLWWYAGKPTLAD